MTKKEKLILFIYSMLLFGATYILYTQVKPIMVCDPDDWTYISSIRYAIPLWKDWNPSKVLPETLMGLCGYFSAYVKHPIIGDYILSFTYVYAFVVSLFIGIYIIAILLFIRKIFDATIQCSLACSLIAYFLHFLFMLNRDTNNLFMLTASNLNCFLNYTIPVLFCFIVTLYFMQKFLFNINSLFLNENLNGERNCESWNYYKIGTIAFVIYLAIFSNMVCNIIIIAPFIYMFSTTILKQIKTDGIKKVICLSNIKRYCFFIYSFLLELICLIFEYNGGRAQDLSFDADFAFGDIMIDVKYIWININKKIAITCVVAICYAILTYIYRKRKGIANNTDNTYIKALKIMLFSFGLTLIYMVLLYVRIGQHKLQRSENIFVIYAWGALQLLFHLDIF